MAQYRGLPDPSSPLRKGAPMASGSDALIQLEDLSKVFYTEDMETHALSGIDLTVSKGEFVSMEGPSGSGKTTLLSLLGLLDTPTQGRYLLGGASATSLSPRDRSIVRNR